MHLTLALSHPPRVRPCIPAGAGYSGRVLDVSPVCASDPGLTNANMQLVVMEVGRRGGPGWMTAPGWRLDGQARHQERDRPDAAARMMMVRPQPSGAGLPTRLPCPVPPGGRRCAREPWGAAAVGGAEAGGCRAPSKRRRCGGLPGLWSGGQAPEAPLSHVLAHRAPPHPAPLPHSRQDGEFVEVVEAPWGPALHAWLKVGASSAATAGCGRVHAARWVRARQRGREGCTPGVSSQLPPAPPRPRRTRCGSGAARWTRGCWRMRQGWSRRQRLLPPSGMRSSGGAAVLAAA